MSFINSINGLGSGFLNELRQSQEAQQVAKQALKQLQDLQKAGANEGKAAIDAASDFGSHLAAPIQGGQGSSGAPSFGAMLGDLVNGVDQKQKAAGAEAQDIMLGKSDNIHQAMIAMQEASVAFNLMVEVRNKLVESYKELSRIQV